MNSQTGKENNADGSVTLYFGPEMPEAFSKENWIVTNSGESWFVNLRFYGPTEAYFDETYPLQDIERVE